MTDTIAAIATARAPAAIGIVRVSGPETLRVVDRVFAAQNGRPARRPGGWSMGVCARRRARSSTTGCA